MKTPKMVNGVQKAALILNYDNFPQVTYDFLIVACVIFMTIKGLASLSKKKEEIPALATPTKEEQLLTKIRDLVKK